MPQRTNAFQRIVTLIHGTLAGQAKVVESAMLRDKVTTEEREVDILITTQAANYNVVIGIEVVSWSRPAGTPWVEKMLAKHNNLEVNKLILISESGFTRPAIKKAKFYGIETLTLENACAIDWNLLAALDSTGVFAVITFNYNCTFLCNFDDGSEAEIDAPLNTSFTAREKHSTLNELVRDIVDGSEFFDLISPHLKGAGENEFYLEYTEPNDLLKIDCNGRLGQVHTLRIYLRILKTETPVHVSQGKYQQSPFFAGLSSQVSSPLQFVVAKKPDGSVGGLLVDKEGVRTLSCVRTLL